MNIAYFKKLFCLDGKTAVVTGASSGIGRAIAVSLANFGAEVALIGRSMPALQQTQQIIAQNGGKSEIYPVDIGDTQAQDAFFDAYRKKHERLDIFIANAGINKRAELPDATVQDMNDMLRVDYIGTVYGLIQASHIMKKQRSGNMVVVTSINGLTALPNQAVYSSIKAALESVAQSLASSMAAYGVRVNSCAPGCIHTGINRHIYTVDAFREQKECDIPLGRIGNPEDIGDVVATMVSDAYRFMTGATVLVDGGEHIRKMQKQPAIDTPVL